MTIIVFVFHVRIDMETGIICIHLKQNAINAQIGITPQPTMTEMANAHFVPMVKSKIPQPMGMGVGV